MKYLKIENTGSLNRKKLELIGLSTKRDRLADTDTIGHKGSGTKLAAVASKRLELDAAIASTDHVGTYLLSLAVDERQEGDVLVRRLLFDYSPSRVVDGKPVNERVPSGLTIEAFQDWDKPIGTDPSMAFKVLREFICNARDEQKGFSLKLVDAPTTVEPGRTAVYLRYTPEIAEMVTRAKASRYFKFMVMDAPLFELPDVGAVYPKSDPDSTRLFLLGVLVECRNDAEQRSIYDYSMFDKSLISEERILKNYWTYLNEVARMFGHLTDKQMIRDILVSVSQHKAPYELDALSRIGAYTPESRLAWLIAVHELFGQKLAVTSWNDTIDRDAEQVYGHTVIGKGSMDLQGFFRRLGIPEASQVTPNKENVRYERAAFSEMDADSKARFHEAFRLFARHFPERASLPIIFFRPLNELTAKMAGFCGLGKRKYKEIWIKTAGPASLGPVQDLFETLLHESRHCVTEADDYDRRFVDQAEKDLSTMVLRLSGHTKLGNGEPLPPAGDITKLRPRIVPVPVPIPDDEVTEPSGEIRKK